MEPLKVYNNKAEKIRAEMGGSAKVKQIHDRGERTVRDHIGAFLDEGSFQEIGTFAHSLRTEDRDQTPGDGKVGGHGEVDGRGVTVCGDDITVKHGSSSIVGIRKLYRLFDRSMKMGIPFVQFAASSGGRIPDTIGAEGISEPGPLFSVAKRRHEIPMASAVLSPSFGGSSFLAALSDFVVMKRGACLSVSSPKVFELAIGERVGFEEGRGTPTSPPSAKCHSKRRKHK